MPRHIDTVEDDLANKLIKLLALAKGSKGDNPAEAENAMAAAVRFATKNDIDLLSINIESAGVSHRVGLSDEPFDNKAFKSCKGSKRRPPSHKFIAQILQKHFKVRVVTCGSEVNIVGRRSDVAFAKYAYGFLHHAFTRCWRKYKHETGAEMHIRASYFAGMYEGLNDKLDREKEDSKQEALLALGEGADAMGKKYALAVVDEKKVVERAMKDFHPHLRYTRTNFWNNTGDSHARHHGYQAGEKTEILAPIAEESYKPDTEKPKALA